METDSKVFQEPGQTSRNRRKFEGERRRFDAFTAGLAGAEVGLVGLKYEPLAADKDAPLWAGRIREHIELLQAVLRQLAPEDAAPVTTQFEWTTKQVQGFERAVGAARSGDKSMALWLLREAEVCLEKGLPLPEALRAYLMRAFHEIVYSASKLTSPDGTAAGYIKAFSETYRPGDANKALNLTGHKGKRPSLHEHSLETWIAAQVWGEIGWNPEKYGFEANEANQFSMAACVVKGPMLGKAAATVAARVSTPGEPVSAKRVKALWRRHKRLFCSPELLQWRPLPW
jgi:hypothetical protein